MDDISIVVNRMEMKSRQIFLIEIGPDYYGIDHEGVCGMQENQNRLVNISHPEAFQPRDLDIDERELASRRADQILDYLVVHLPIN